MIEGDFLTPAISPKGGVGGSDAAVKTGVAAWIGEAVKTEGQEKSEGEGSTEEAHSQHKHRMDSEAGEVLNRTDPAFFYSGSYPLYF